MFELGPRAMPLAAICVLALSAGWPNPAKGQSVAEPGLFDAAAEGDGGNKISLEQCHRLEQDQTAVWVKVQAKGWCLRYYAFGLGGENAIAAAWLNGDIVGGDGTSPAGHQTGLGPMAMIEQERVLSQTYRTPFIFLARPGTYGSAGEHRALHSTKLEADLVAAEIDALTARYGVRSWVLGGHSGGGTDVAALLARRHDIRCAVVSSGGAAYSAYLTAHHQSWRIRSDNLNAIDDVGKIPISTASRVIVMGDPRDRSVFWSVQHLYYDALKERGINVTLLPLKRGWPPEFHSLVNLAEAATGLCAQGVATSEIETRLRAMPSQAPRESN